MYARAASQERFKLPPSLSERNFLVPWGRDCCIEEGRPESHTSAFLMDLLPPLLLPAGWLAFKNSPMQPPWENEKGSRNEEKRDKLFSSDRNPDDLSRRPMEEEPFCEYGGFSFPSLYPLFSPLRLALLVLSEWPYHWKRRGKGEEKSRRPEIPLSLFPFSSPSHSSSLRAAFREMGRERGEERKKRRKRRKNLSSLSSWALTFPSPAPIVVTPKIAGWVTHSALLDEEDEGKV